MNEERVNLLEVVRILVKGRRIIIVSTVAAFLISAIVSLILPKWYKARATILPPESGTSQTDVVGLMRFAGYQPALLPTVTSPSEIYTAILGSSRVTNAVIDSLDLMTEYGTESRLNVLDRVMKHVEVGVTRESLVRVEYEDRDRERSARVANAFVGELDRFNRETRVTSARRVREFIENRILQAEMDLEVAEVSLKEFKEGTGVVFVSEQAKASIETAAELYGRIVELEVSRERLRQFATDRSPEIMDIKSQIRTLEKNLAQMGYATAEHDETAKNKLFPSFSNAPEMEMRLAGLMREVEIKRSVYRVLSEQYEEAKIQEMRDTPTLHVLDWAEPPLIRSKPKRKIMVGVSGAFAFLLSSFVVIYRNKVWTGRNRETDSSSGQA
jgi:tyrosine-protein kinase Etk/Wzc